MSKEIAEEYASSLADLTVNSKPLINMLTILAEENIEHAGIIVDTVEKHLEKVPPEIKLPVLYLVDSIIKNVGGAYTQKFSQSIVNMFTRTFKQVDEKIRSQMFKLRETWHDVFPPTKLYQLDVKVNLIDPAWPIQAQPHQSNIHVNPNFLKKTAPTTSTAQPVLSEEERNIIAKKEQELLMLQKKKIEMELEQTRKQLELAEKNAKKITTIIPPAVSSPAMPIALVNPVVAPVMTVTPDLVTVPVKHRLGPPVNKSGARIAPVSAALATARRDPRLAKHRVPPAPPIPPVVLPSVQPIAPNVFDIKPLERTVTKRKNVITIDVRPEVAAPKQSRDPRRRDTREARPNRNRPRRREPTERSPTNALNTTEPERDVNNYIEKLQIPDPKKINKLPPIPKINRDESAPPKRRKETARDRKKKEDSSKDDSSNSSPEKRGKKSENKKKREPRIEPEPAEPENEVVAFKELKNYHKERYMRRNKEKSDSPEPKQAEKMPEPTDASSKISVNVTRMWG